MEIMYKRDMANAATEAMVIMALSDRGNNPLLEASEIEDHMERKYGCMPAHLFGYRRVLNALNRLRHKGMVKSRGRNQQCATLWFVPERVQ